MNNISKAFWILRNEGPTSLSKKATKVIKRATHFKKTTAVQNEAYNYLSNPLFDITQEDIEKSKTHSQKIKDPSSVLWFVPYFDHVTYGGIYTIFRFIDYFARQGLKTTIVIFDNKYFDVGKMKKDVAEYFPALLDAQVINFDPGTQSFDKLPSSDIAFATIWMSAYLLLKYSKTKHKYYFIQDYEPLFYEGGSMYALAESTYRFGFTGIVNTPGLLQAVNQRHGLEGISFIPAVDSRYYYPDPITEDNKCKRIFFYARPNNPRNAFELGILTIKILLERYGKKIEIVTAGANWDEARYGLRGKITNKGLLDSLEEVGDLYRTCDIGFVYMLSKHPSYQPFEFMACGMATVTNRNEDNLWLFRDRENCLISEPSPASMAKEIGLLVDDDKLRNRIAKHGQKDISYDWQKQLADVWAYIKND